MNKNKDKNATIVNVTFERLSKYYFNVCVNSEYTGSHSHLNSVIVKILKTKYKELESQTLFTDSGAYPYGRLKYKDYYYDLDVETLLSELIDKHGISGLNEYIKEELEKIIKWKEDIDKRCGKFSLTFKI